MGTQRRLGQKGDYVLFVMALLVSGTAMALWVRSWGPFVQMVIFGVFYIALDTWKYARRRQAILKSEQPPPPIFDSES